MEKSPKKWSLGNILFRKSKKDIPQADFSSEEDDFKAGFGSEFIAKKSPVKVKQQQQQQQQQYKPANPEFHFYKPHHQQQQQQQYYYPQQQQPQQQHYQRPAPQIYQNNTNLEHINNQINLEKSRATTLSPQYIYNNNNNYLQYQGSSQDEKSSYNSLSSPINKSSSENGSRTSLNNKKTRSARNERYYQRILRDDGRPLTVYGSANSIEPPLSVGGSRLSSSICSSEFLPPATQSLPATRVFRGSVNTQVDKDDYENIHEVEEAVPPPIPPRDPSRRFSIHASASSVSQNPYYFDHALQKYVIFNMNGKCYSDDRLWKSEAPKERQNKLPQQQQQQQQHDILRPRSRKPLNLHTNLDNECVLSSEDVVDNPRHPISQRSKSAIDFEKMMAMHEASKPRSKYHAHKQRNMTSVDGLLLKRQASDELQALRKKYSSAEDVKVSMRQKLPASNGATVATRKSLNAMDLKVKDTAGLDDAINELETMYKNLVKDENLMERAARRDLPTPTKFTQLMRKYEEYENEENRNDREPDIVADDVFSRNLKHANQKLKTLDHQPPFGIPNKHLYPIPPKPAQDYLSVEPPRKVVAAQPNPDLVADDLAVRNLRKDNPNGSRRKNLIEIDNNHFMKRNHTQSSLSELIYNDILKDSAKASGGILEKYSQYEIPTEKSEKEVKSKLFIVSNNNNKSEREDFENSLNALVVESKAISQKLEKDLSKLKRESVTPKPTVVTQPQQQQPKTLVNLLDFRKSVEREKKPEPERPQMTSTACSPIKDLQDICPPKEEIIKSQAPKQQKTEKIENLIKMFNTTTLSSPESAKKATGPAEKPSRKLSDLSNMFETKPPTQPSSAARADVKKTASSASLAGPINPRMVSPTVASPKASSKVIITQKVLLGECNNTTAAAAAAVVKADVESNINNIKELIQQIKLTEFEKNASKTKPDILKSAHGDLPDYDNIRDDYEMTDGGKLERIAPRPAVIQATLLIKPAPPPDEIDEISPELKSLSSSSSLRETSVESSSEPVIVAMIAKEEPLTTTAIYRDAIEFLQESADQKSAVVEDHKSPPLKSIRENKEVVLGYIDKINESLSNSSSNSNGSEDQQPKMSVKESVSKLEEKIILSRQNSEAEPPTPEPSTPTQIKPVVLPKVGPSDTESLYNSSEELSMIFGHGEQQQAQQSTPMHPGKIVEEEDFEAEFEKIAHDDEILDDKVLDENFNVTLIDINNNSEYVKCFDNELSDVTNESAMSTKSAADVAAASTSDANNNSLTSDLSKPTINAECFNSTLLHRKPNSLPSTSNHSDVDSNSFSPKSSSSAQKSRDSSQQQPLKTQCILLACVYCIMLYLQFIIYNFKQTS